MYDLRQFKLVLYSLVLLGVTGFGLAAQAPGMWVMATGAIFLNAWLVMSDRFRPMPRLVANAITVLGLIVLTTVVRQGIDTPILIIGHFLILLQLIKLYEQRANRDLAQLIVLSLLLMIAAAITTASLLFGIILITYLVLAMYGCLLFHLKVEVDKAQLAAGLPEETTSAASLRWDRRRLSRSMLRMTSVVALFAATGAVLTFLFFPRGAPGGMLNPLQWNPGDNLTGFSDTVSFQHVARITQSEEKVAWVRVTQNGQPFRGLLVLRGVALDYYSGSGDETRENAYEWRRTSQRELSIDAVPNTYSTLRPTTREESARQFDQSIVLEGTRTTALFAIGGAFKFKPENRGRVFYTRPDEVISSSEAIASRFKYEVVSTGQLTADPTGLPPIEPRTIDPKIEEFVRKPEVSGSDEQGPLVARRPKQVRVSPLDAGIARNIESYLRSNFTYTLDLTDAARIEGQDPMVAFLYDLKRGHCEYFAGAMTLMCQSLGMQARLVVGFMCDEYNALGDYYQVRQSHAHAWVEVLNSDGVWETFDPTSSRLAESAAFRGVFGRLAELFDYIEYTWQSAIIGYDRDSRSTLLQSLDSTVGGAALRASEAIKRARKGLSDWHDTSLPYVSLGILTAIVALAALVLVAAVFLFLFERWRLRRRARRIGLDTLPVSEQLLLARQLGFYDQLLQLLEHLRILRPAHLTPREFSESLSFLPSDAFGMIRHVTGVFYRVRYGRVELSGEQQREMMEVIAEVENILTAHP